MLAPLPNLPNVSDNKMSEAIEDHLVIAILFIYLDVQYSKIKILECNKKLGYTIIFIYICLVWSSFLYFPGSIYCFKFLKIAIPEN